MSRISFYTVTAGTEHNGELYFATVPERFDNAPSILEPDGEYTFKTLRGAEDALKRAKALIERNGWFIEPSINEIRD